MEKSRKHRISKWLVLVIAGPLMLALYVAEYGLMHWMTGKCWLSRDQPALPAAFEPSSVNIQYGLPGGELFRDFGQCCYWRGTGVEITWEELPSRR